jgi:GWxTD domain-containing protein
MPRIRNAGVLCALTLLVATTASAAISKKYEEWRNGPAQWLMTSDDTRAWRNVKTDQQASDFIDLFWARRDPTPGTPENEYRSEFEGRVVFSDKNYAEKGRRGSLTDRGRVYIVLGTPDQGATEAGQTSKAKGLDTDLLGGRQTAERTEWIYKYAKSSKWGIPEAKVVFLANPNSGRVTRDVQRGDWGQANAGAVKAAVVNPDMKEVPPWALRGGLEPMAIRILDAETVRREQQANEDAAAALRAQQAAQAGTSKNPKVIEATVPMPEVKWEPTGVGRLTLTRNVFEIDPETRNDPFAKMASVATFKANEELGWASQICAATNDEPNVKFTVRLTGTAAGEVIDRASDVEEMVPDRIRALSGCYMLRGEIPLEGMSPGSYELQVAIADPNTGRDSVLKQAFRIE